MSPCLLAWAGHAALFHAGAINTPLLPFLIAIVVCTVAAGIGPGLLSLAFTEFMARGFMMLTHHAHASLSIASLSIGNPVAATALISAGMAVVVLTNFGASAVIKLDQATRELRAINETLEARRPHSSTLKRAIMSPSPSPIPAPA